MRAGFEAARDSGVNIAIFSANTCYWQVRMENSSSGVPNRVLVGFKESAPTYDPLLNDPLNSTTRWRDQWLNRPENGLWGVMYGDWSASGQAYHVTNSSHPFYRNTGLTNSSTIAGIVGTEWDNLTGLPTSNQPTPIPGLVVLSNSSVTGNSGGSTANAVVHQAPSGALVFAAGTIDWSWGLDSYRAGANIVSAPLKQMTANILMDMGAIPATPTGGLVVSTSYSISGTVSPPVANVTTRGGSDEGLPVPHDDLRHLLGAAQDYDASYWDEGDDQRHFTDEPAVQLEHR